MNEELRERNMYLIKKGIQSMPQYKDLSVGVYSIAESKNHVFKVNVGMDELKIRVLPGFEPSCLELHKYLLSIDPGFKVPKLIDMVRVEDRILKVMEWLPGTPLNKLTENGSNQFQFLADEYFYKWGECMARLNNIKYETMNYTMNDIWWWNFILIDDGTLIPCDMSKLQAVTCPEQDIMRWIIMNITIPIRKKKVFIEGYCKLREFDPQMNFLEAMEYMVKRSKNELNA